MTTEQILHHFFKHYGSTISSADGKTVRGIISRTDSQEVRSPQVDYDPLGFSSKRTYLLLAPANSAVLLEGSTVSGNGRRFRITETDQTRLGNEVLCDRAYAYEQKEEIL